MADQKLTELIALTTVVGTDIIYIVSDPGGSALSRKITRDNFLNSAGNNFGDFNYVFKDNRLQIENPAGDFKTTIVNAAQTGDYNLTIPVLGAHSTLSVLELAQTFTAAKTFTTGLLKIADLSDANGNKSLACTATASAVDFFTIINAAAANPATIQLNASGSDSNINVLIGPKGTGKLQFANGADATKLVQITNSGMTTAKIANLIFANTDNRDYTFPDAAGTLALLSLAQTWTAKQTLYGTIDTLAALTSSASIEIDFDTQETMTLTLAHNTTFTTANKGAGKKKTIFITCDGTTRTMAFPSWKPQGAALPASIAANKTATLTLECTSTTDSSVWAGYAAEP